MGQLYAVQVTSQNGTRWSYHSVWSSRADAKRQCDVRTRHAGDTGLRCRMIPVEPVRYGRDWHNRKMVSFRDSVGFIDLVLSRRAPPRSVR